MRGLFFASTHNRYYRFFCQITACVLSLSLVLGPSAAHAQSLNLLNLPVPGTMLAPSPAFTPVLLKGLTIHPDNPLQFDFIIDSGTTQFTADEVKLESERLVKYFLASMTVPKDDLWVNLSPYEKDRIIPEELGKTELGRDMLAQDYILKQLTASLMYPEEELGKKFWDRVYKKAEEEFGTSQVPVNTFNKVWILPDVATVYEHEQTVYIVDAHLKVMLDSDYMAMKNADVGTGLKPVPTNQDISVSSDIIREIILPEIEREVNEGKHFAPLRQIYHSLILAKWYKETVKNSLLTQVYADKNLIDGVDVDDPAIKDQIYARYMDAYKKGVFNYIKEDFDRLTNETIPRKYFSGGLEIGAGKIKTLPVSSPVLDSENPTFRERVRIRETSSPATERGGSSPVNFIKQSQWYIDRLVKKMNNPKYENDMEKRIPFIVKLGDSGNKAAIAPLVERFKKENVRGNEEDIVREHVLVRQRIIEALGKLEAYEEIGELVPAFKKLYNVKMALKILADQGNAHEILSKILKKREEWPDDGILFDTVAQEIEKILMRLKVAVEPYDDGMSDLFEEDFVNPLSGKLFMELKEMSANQRKEYLTALLMEEKPDERSEAGVVKKIAEELREKLSKAVPQERHKPLDLAEEYNETFLGLLPKVIGLHALEYTYSLKYHGNVEKVYPGEETDEDRAYFARMEEITENIPFPQSYDASGHVFRKRITDVITIKRVKVVKPEKPISAKSMFEPPDEGGKIIPPRRPITFDRSMDPSLLKERIYISFDVLNAQNNVKAALRAVEVLGTKPLGHRQIILTLENVARAYPDEKVRDSAKEWLTNIALSSRHQNNEVRDKARQALDRLVSTEDFKVPKQIAPKSVSLKEVWRKVYASYAGSEQQARMRVPNMNKDFRITLEDMTADELADTLKSLIDDMIYEPYTKRVTTDWHKTETGKIVLIITNDQEIDLESLKNQVLEVAEEDENIDSKGYFTISSESRENRTTFRLLFDHADDAASISPLYIANPLDKWATVEGVKILRGGQAGPGSEDDEILALTDEHGNPTGKAARKTDVYKPERWHMASHIYIFDKIGRLLLQLRTSSKKLSPGKLQVSVSGGVNTDENPEEAALREGEEETGITLDEDRLIQVTEVNEIKRSYQSGELTNNEFTTVYAYQATDEELARIEENYNTNESDEFWLVPAEVFEQMEEEEPDLFSRSLNHIIRHQKETYEKIKAAGTAASPVKGQKTDIYEASTPVEKKGNLTSNLEKGLAALEKIGRAATTDSRRVVNGRTIIIRKKGPASGPKKEAVEFFEEALRRNEGDAWEDTTVLLTVVQQFKDDPKVAQMVRDAEHYKRAMDAADKKLSLAEDENLMAAYKRLQEAKKGFFEVSLKIIETKKPELLANAPSSSPVTYKELPEKGKMLSDALIEFFNSDAGAHFDQQGMTREEAAEQFDLMVFNIILSTPKFIKEDAGEGFLDATTSEKVVDDLLPAFKRFFFNFLREKKGYSPQVFLKTVLEGRNFDPQKLHELLSGKKENIFPMEKFYKKIRLDTAASPVSETHDIGGIDLNNIAVERRGGGVDIQFDPAEIQGIIDRGITGFTPVIIDFTPLPSILPLLGLAPQREEEPFEVSSLN